MNYKKVAYILLFTILGVILSTILHGLIEIPVILLLISDFKKYGLGLSWSDWYLTHHVGTVILFLGGIVLGIFLGFKYWKKIYEKSK